MSFHYYCKLPAALILGLCCIVSLVLVPAIGRDFFYQQQEKGDPISPLSKIKQSTCLSTVMPKVKEYIKVGNLNRRALNKVEPVYPDKAKKLKLSGVAIVDVIVDLPSGKIEMAKIRKTNSLFKSEVEKVICSVSFPPLTDIDIKSKAIGYLTYTFIAPK